jgi:hypothetical protein
MMRASLCTVLACLCGFFAPQSQAGYVVTLVEQNGNVVATGSGTIDLTDLTFQYHAESIAGIIPNEGVIQTGPAQFTSSDTYTGVTGPSNFGSGVEQLVASSGSGDMVTIGPFGPGTIGVPDGYVSGSPLSDTSTFDNQTFASLEVTPGTYVWTWGTGADADSFTLDIVATATAAPEPASLTLLGLGVVGLAGYG